MPELPEVEVVRRGLHRWVAGRTVAHVQVAHPRAVRRHLAGPADFEAALTGVTLGAAHRRGKYLWLPVIEPAQSGRALLAHLGMSGQLLVLPPDTPPGPHLRIRFGFTGGGCELRFVDQRTFGGLSLEPCSTGLPDLITHIAADPLDPEFDAGRFASALRRRRTGLKRALLDQSLISGVGNIYADEALWRSRLHYARPTETMRRFEVDRLLEEIRTVMGSALDAGGTSFDSLYVDINGSSGFFSRSLHVYGRAGRACDRCSTPIRREPFMNRSSFRCPRCQPRPRRPRW
ncbi:MAG: DNA-formamidopyrimidine glycosylase [Pseudonocardiales bacterium]|nr:MAG: DNA-formamidopyrimidine glycosylase [Pseudonocardiales bacterium]